MRVLLTGATGAIGPAVRKALLADGLAVRVLARRPGAEVPPADMVIGDLADPEALQRAVRGADAVVHLAALLHVTDPPPSLEAEYRRLNLDATRALVEAARAAGVRRFVFASTTAVYGDTGGALVTEASPTAPASWYAASKLAAEAVVREAHEAGAFETVVLRLSAVYGPRLTGNYRRLLEAMARGRFLPIGRGDNRRSLIFDADVGRAMALALRHPAAGGGVFNVADGAPHRIRDIERTMAAALGRPLANWAIPVPIALAAAVIAAPLGPRAPLSRSALAKYLEDSAVDASLIRQRLGFAPEVDLARGWSLTVAALQAAGDLPVPGRTRGAAS